MGDDKQNFTQIPNEFLDDATRFKLAGECWKCLIFIMRNTWGWHRKTAELRIKDIAKGTGLLARNVIRSLRSLENNKIIVVLNSENKRSKRYRINYRYDFSRKPDEIFSNSRTNILNPENKCSQIREQNVLESENNNSRNPTTDAYSNKPKENKIKLKKTKESAKAKESKKVSLASLNHKPKSAQRQKQELAEWQKANNSS